MSGGEGLPAASARWSERIRAQAVELRARAARLRDLAPASGGGPVAAELRSHARRCDSAAESLARAAEALARHEAAP